MSFWTRAWRSRLTWREEPPAPGPGPQGPPPDLRPAPPDVVADEPPPQPAPAAPDPVPAGVVDGRDPGFDADPHPGRPKILFVGWPESSHTHSWIDLVAHGPFNVRLFCLPSSEPPPDWRVRCYLTGPSLPRRDEAWRRTAHPPDPTGPEAAKTVEEALADVIRTWRPDVVHTLGFDPASYFYRRARTQFGLAGLGRWVAQARGGPDLALQYYSPDFRPQIENVLRECDHFIADNQQNYDNAARWGLDPAKARDPGMGVVSGPGGIDVDGLRARWTDLPSRRERIIVWPKCYETYTAKAMPVFEAILKVWPQIAPCRIEMLWLVQPEVRIWYEKLFPPELKQHCVAHPRLSRDETLDHMVNARVMMAPSLSDGIPNSMMEAMALGAAPMVSPLDTIAPVVEDGVHVLFARNLYPDEIAAQLVRLMSDDALVDRLATNNLRRVRELADRGRVKAQAEAFYEAVGALASRP